MLVDTYNTELDKEETPDFYNVCTNLNIPKNIPKCVFILINIHKSVANMPNINIHINNVLLKRSQ